MFGVFLSLEVVFDVNSELLEQAQDSLQLSFVGDQLLNGKLGQGSHQRCDFVDFPHLNGVLEHLVGVSRQLDELGLARPYFLKNSDGFVDCAGVVLVGVGVSFELLGFGFS